MKALSSLQPSAAIYLTRPDCNTKGHHWVKPIRERELTLCKESNNTKRSLYED